MVVEGLSDKVIYEHSPEGVEECDRHKKGQRSARPQGIKRLSVLKKEQFFFGLNCVPTPPKKYIKVLSSCTSDCNFI